MSSPTVSLHQTLNLLDHADALRQAEADQREQTRNQLTAHLQTVSETLGHPLSDALAQQAVDNSLSGQPVANFALGGPLDRPVSLAAWKEEQASLAQALVPLRNKWRRVYLVEHVTTASGITSSLTALFSGVCYAGMVAHNQMYTRELYAEGLIKGLGIVGLARLGLGLISGFVYWAGHFGRRRKGLSQIIEKMEDRQHALTAIDPQDRPRMETIKAWCEVPGNLAACHQVLSSEVPFLKGDGDELKRRYEVYMKAIDDQKKADQKARIQARKALEIASWDHDFRQWVQSRSAEIVSPEA